MKPLTYNGCSHRISTSGPALQGINLIAQGFKRWQKQISYLSLALRASPDGPDPSPRGATTRKPPRRPSQRGSRCAAETANASPGPARRSPLGKSFNQAIIVSRSIAKIEMKSHLRVTALFTAGRELLALRKVLHQPVKNV